MPATVATQPAAAPAERRGLGGPRSEPVTPLAPETTARTVRPRRRRRWVTVALLVLLAAALAGIEMWRRQGGATAIRYVTAPVTRGAITRAVTASGSVNPVITIQVGTYVSGVIQALYCDYNTVVRKGQLCAKIDPRPYQVVVEQNRANLSTAKAQLAKDQASLGQAKLTFDRTADLGARGIVSQDALDAARSAYQEAVAQVELDRSTIEQRQAALKAAEINLAYTNIVSPVNGTVVSRSVTMGQTVAASFQTPTLFLIATDLTKMQVDANVSESDIGGIAAGNSATFTVEAFPGRVFEGMVTQVRQAPQTVQNVVTYDVVVSVENSQLLLKPGMTATVRIVTDRRDNALRVPDQALRYFPGGVSARAGEAGRQDAATRVWVLRDGRPTEVQVRTGLNDDRNVEVLQGALDAGDEVITGEETSGGKTTSGRPPLLRL